MVICERGELRGLDHEITHTKFGFAFIKLSKVCQVNCAAVLMKYETNFFRIMLYIMYNEKRLTEKKDHLVKKLGRPQNQNYQSSSCQSFKEF